MYADTLSTTSPGRWVLLLCAREQFAARRRASGFARTDESQGPATNFGGRFLRDQLLVDGSRGWRIGSCELDRLRLDAVGAIRAANCAGVLAVGLSAWSGGGRLLTGASD